MSFILPNQDSKKPLADFLCPTLEIEKRAGLSLWDRLHGEKAEKLKNSKMKMWELTTGTDKFSHPG